MIANLPRDCRGSEARATEGWSHSLMASDIKEDETAGGPQGPGRAPHGHPADSIDSRPGAAAGRRAEEPAPAKKQGDLRARILTAIVAVPILIFGIQSGGIIWTAIVALIVVAGSWEFYHFMEAKGLRGSKGLGTLGCVALAVVSSFSNEYFVTLLLTVLLLAVFTRQLRKPDISTAITGVSVTVFGIVYVGWLTCHLIWIRNLGSELQLKYFSAAAASPQMDPDFLAVGRFYLYLAVACTFLADTGGYFGGRAFGRHKLAPSISPKKTWEGFAGSVVGAVVCALVVRRVFLHVYAGEPFKADFPYAHCVIVGVLVAVSGLMGDLFESMLKRDAQVKDASGLLPGHGGFLDRLDSINFAVPVTYYYVKLYYYWAFAPRTGSGLRGLGDYLSRYIVGS